jgi:plasmid maintenance system antidote protein VapI
MTPKDVRDTICDLIERRVILLNAVNPQDTGIAKFARLLGIHRRTVMRWLAGTCKPSPDMQSKINKLKAHNESQ